MSIFDAYGALAADIKHLSEQLNEANRRLEEITSELYGKGLDVVGWHLNGDLEPLDTWFDDNEWGPVPEEWKPNV